MKFSALKSLTLPVVALCLSVLLSACQSVKTSPQRGAEEIATKTILPVAASKVGKGQGAVAIAIEWRGVEKAGLDGVTCRWRVIENETRQSTFINVRIQDNLAFARLPSGQYQTARLGCGVGRVWELDGIFKEGFQVEASQVSYLGKLIFEFKGREMDTVRKASRAENASAFESVLEAARRENMNVISGFTGRQIDRQMIEAGELKENFDVHVTGKGASVQTVEPLMKVLRSCANSEGSRDPLRFGKLDYTAVYRQGRFSEMKERREQNAFSDQLRACVERGMMAFHPGLQEIEIRVQY